MAADPTPLENRHLAEVTVHIQTNRPHPVSSLPETMENGRANDNCGYVLAAQPGQSQGRTATTTDSQSILEDLGLPNLRSPGSPGPGQRQRSPTRHHDPQQHCHGPTTPTVPTRPWE